MGTLTLASLGSSAYAAMDISDAMALCSRISKADARVECYDQVAKDAASGLFQRGAPATAQAPAPAAAATPNWAAPPNAVIPAQRPGTAAPSASASSSAPVSGFGASEVNRGQGDGGPDSIQAEVASSSDNGLQQWRIRLADGAIWQMTERVSMFRPPAPHEVITIRKGALGSFLMDVGKQGSVRVRRVQ
jgi:hypothetical protein